MATSILDEGKIKGNRFYFNDLYTQGVKKPRVWRMCIQLVPAEVQETDLGKDWNPKDFEALPLKKRHLKGELAIPEDSVAMYWSENGTLDGKMSIHVPSFGRATNVGKKNERNSLLTAIIAARKKYNDRLNKGAVLSLDELESTGAPSKKAESKGSGARIFPMLAHVYGDYPIKYPCYVQPKLDGVRAVIRLIATKEGPQSLQQVEIYSRNLKDFDASHEELKKELLPYLEVTLDDETGEHLYLDGEFYAHKTALQDVVGMTRGATHKPAKDFKFHIFDAFYPSKLDMDQTGRMKLLDGFFKGVSDPKYFTRVPTFEVANAREADRMYQQFLDDKFEGMMYRVNGCPYSGGYKVSSTLRSKCLLKRKPFFESEFLIEDFTSGKKGEATNFVIWICKTPKGKQFHVKPEGTDQERRRWLEEARLDFSKFKGQKITVRYQDLSKDGVPLRALGIMAKEEEPISGVLRTYE